MAVKLRLRREGSKKAPYYRVVAADARSPRDGRFIEILGYYQPTADPSRIELDGERALYWLHNGAQPTDAVQNLLRIVGVWEQFKPGDAPRRQRVKPERAEARTRATPQAQSTGGDTSPGAEAPEDVGEPPEAQTAAPAAETDTTQPTAEEGAS